jgi:hypothetical protein
MNALSAKVGLKPTQNAATQAVPTRIHGGVL